MKIPGLLSYLVIAVWCALTVQADDIEWINPSGGNFNETSNWAGNRIPGIEDTALFNLAKSEGYSVQLNRNVTNSSLLVQTENVTIDLSGLLYRLTRTESPSLVIGDSFVESILKVKNGILSINSILVSPATGNTGILRIAGPTTYVKVSEDFILANRGSAQAYINDGANLHVGGNSFFGLEDRGFGEMFLEGPDTTFTTNKNLYIGYHKSGSIIAENRSDIKVHGDIFIASDNMTYGMVILDNSSLSIEGDLYAGTRGKSRLRAVNGSIVTINGDGNIATSETAQDNVLIKGKGSELIINGITRIGFEQDSLIPYGKLEISEEASVHCKSDVIVDLSPNSASSTVRVEQRSHWKVDGFLDVGINGNGRIDIVNSTALVDGPVRLGIGVAGKGLLSVGNGIFESGQPIQVGVDGPGIVLAHIAGEIITPQVIVSPTSSIYGRKGTIISDVITEGLTFIGDNSSRIEFLNVVGSFTQNSSGMLYVHFADVDGSIENDILQITESAYFAGEFRLLGLREYIPQAGNRFDIITADNIEYAFDTFTLQELPNDRVWMIDMLPERMSAYVAGVPVGIELVHGNIVNGSTAELRDSDDSVLEALSIEGGLFTQRQVFEMDLTTSVPTVPEYISVIIESHIDSPSGTARVMLKNWNTDKFDLIGSYALDMEDQRIVLEGIDSDRYIRDADGEITMKINHSVTRFDNEPFRSYFDQIAIRAN